MDEQHGFRPGRSTKTCNTVFRNYILEALKAHSRDDVLFTDFCKGFDSVDQYALLCVLQATASFGKPLSSWFHYLIDGRKQFVKIHRVSSDRLSITSGGHLFALLFSVFLNGIYCR